MNYILTSIRLALEPVSDADDQLLHERLMRPQQAALRVTYQRLRAGGERQPLYHELRETFPWLTGASVNDAILMAQAVLSSQQELLPERIQDVTTRLRRAERRLQHELHHRAGPRSQRVQAYRRLIDRLETDLEQLQAHQEAGTVPPALFGGRALWSQVERRLPGARDAWRARRTRQFFSRGAAREKGNPHCRLGLDTTGAIQLSVRVPISFVQRGQHLSTRPRWLTFAVCYGQRYASLLRRAIAEGVGQREPYTVRLLRLAPGEYIAYVTVREPVAHHEYPKWEDLPAWCIGVAGVDLNLDHLTVVVSDAQGQFRAWKIFAHPNLGELSRPKTQWQVGNIARDVVRWLQEHEVQALVIEDLNIQPSGGRSAHYHRRTVAFAYRQLAQALVRRALREGLVVKRVAPTYTSWIGSMKYASQYGVSTHVSAAYVIARRGLGLPERLPRRLIRAFPELIALLGQEIAGLESQVEKDAVGEAARRLETRREWLNRLKDWKSYSPAAGRPWLLWATLRGMSRSTSGARDVLARCR